MQDKAGSGTTIYATYSNYTSQGQAQTITYGNGVVTTSTFADPAHSTCIPANSFKLCTLKTQKGTNPLYQDFTYTFTADGNVDLITDPINGNQDFGYDALDRLTTATGPYDTGGAPLTITYTYNQIGNILTNSQLTAGTFTYPTGGPGVVRPHAVQVAGPYQYSYDNNGNQTGITSTLGDYSSSTTFNVDNRLASAVTTFGTTTINSTFVYDGDGSRVKKVVGTTTTRYISKLYECDTTGTNTSCSRFIWANNTRIATVAVTNGTTHYWHGDHLGSSSVITDSTGAKVQALTYYPYGDVRTNVPGTPVNVPYKFTGKELDASSNLYFYEARYYHAVFGRFIAPDTIVPNLYDPQSLNRYSYARNNPLLYTDPSGHFFKNIFKHVFRNAGRVFSRQVNEVFRIANEIGHKPLNLISPTFWLESSYSLHPALAPFRAAGLGGELDSGQRAIHKFRNSNTGRWVDASVIVTATAIGTFYCGGCGTLATIPSLGLQIGTQAVLLGATVGSASGLAQAAFTGGDPFQAAAMGGLIGAGGGALGGAIGDLAKVGFASILPASLPEATAAAISKASGLFTGSVAGGTFGGGLSAAAGGTNIGHGLALGALGGAIGGAIQAGYIGEGLGKVLGDAGGFGVYGANGIKPPARAFIDGGIDWTSGWLATQTEDN